MIAVMIFFILLMTLLIGSYFYYCKKSDKTFRLSITLTPVPIISAFIGLILLIDYIQHYMNRPYITLLSEFIVTRQGNYAFYIQIFFYSALISVLVITILFIIENFIIGRKKK